MLFGTKGGFCLLFLYVVRIRVPSGIRKIVLCTHILIV